MRFATLALVLLSMPFAGERAVAFNCSNVSFASSIVICSDAELTRLADERQQIYNETVARLTADQKAALWENQKAWVRSYATACGVPPDNPPAIPASPTVLACFRSAAEARAAYLRTYGLAGSTSVAALAQSSAAPDADEVALVREDGGLFDIPVEINRAITLNFVIDSGASDVQIPLDVFSTLVRAKTIVPTDLMDETTYILADGSKQKSPKFHIRELRVGHHILRNVAASVGSANSALLLGQSFLANFDSWTLDNKNHVLRLTGKSTEQNDGNATARGGTDTGETASLMAPVMPRRAEPAAQHIAVCGKEVEYTIDQVGSSGGFLGVWSGSWSNGGRLCGGLIVESVAPGGAADVIYVYGPSRPGSALAWKQQHRVGRLHDGVLSFQDDQGSAFTFETVGFGALGGDFVSGSGHLTGVFQKLR
ncbi:MAG TPA: retropepsin-like aspartic protease [Stellaceae bacterium]|jgi:clan AA aspartic protease (TIGR02281 family)|nr:retropepsin-like aspartic protease [Stellaceae bacterium]